MDGEPSLEAVMGSLESQLERGLRQGSKLAARSAIESLQRHQSSHSQKIKLDYMGEKRVLTVPRPVMYDEVCAKIRKMYGFDMNIAFTQSNGELRSPICNQKDLDIAISLVDKNERSTSLRLILTSPSGQGHGQVRRTGAPSIDTGYSSIRSQGRDIESPSPPPGSLPHNFSHSVSCNSINSEGEFIPESDETVFRSPDGSVAESLDSNYMSSYGGDAFSLRGRTSSRRSILPGDDEGRNQFGTFPRSMGSLSQQMVDGPSTFPRIRPTVSTRPDLSNSLRSVMSSRGSEGTMSTVSSSSNSSGFPPDHDMDSPDGRSMIKRNSDLDSPVYALADLSLSKSPRCPVNWKAGALLGSGAFGEVYVCHDKDTGRDLAMKVVRLEQMNAETSKEVRALENEIHLLRNFEHERIVSYFGCAQDKQSLYIFMEYLPGGSIKDEITKYGSLTENVSRKYTKQMLEGLAYLHKNVIVHRDIKGANILRDGNGNIKLGDFGASKRLQTIVSATGLHSVVGTPYWMAPEVINGEGYGRKADIWSVGCTIVEMLTTKPPWAEFESMAALYKIAMEKRPHFTLPNHISELCHDVLSKAFDRNPSTRPTAIDLLGHRWISG
ncbi:mitogen-activated protein kinase kinase kinase 2-like [Crassostrea virginica]|uniref:Mitogen-activated protein kinase kinase kinase 2-like n=1 Tax=Crassostrea virginica TaxID=6565 RepID=A0A8B8D5G2_CRAVI|nr:mitogen-activated protein kinase kinase kinase 2-like [Crassostrea virginica]